MRVSWRLYGIVLALLVVVGFTTWAAALPQMTAHLRTLYKPTVGTDFAKAMPCKVCHTSTPALKTNLNAYGLDLQKAAKGTYNDAGFKAIEGLDSDKDGYTNVVELRAGTLPGDPNSKPKK
jgi:hypothetical protein